MEWKTSAMKATVLLKMRLKEDIRKWNRYPIPLCTEPLLSKCHNSKTNVQIECNHNQNTSSISHRTTENNPKSHIESRDPQ